jgi:8-oxo-dGTP pyrophosphatase MutT (NUDIX family)
MTDPEIIRIESKVVYKNRWMKVREDRVRRPNGDHGLFGVVDKPDFSLIIPFDGEVFHMVQQYRYPVDGRYWEFPQGSLELTPDKTPEDVAAVELAEETGLRAGSMLKLGKLFQAYGYANQAVHIFLASDLVAGEQNLASEEQGLLCGTFTRLEVDAMIQSGEIADVSTVAALHVFDRESS